jgi:hypothetical protein
MSGHGADVDPTICRLDLRDDAVITSQRDALRPQIFRRPQIQGRGRQRPGAGPDCRRRPALVDSKAMLRLLLLSLLLTAILPTVAAADDRLVRGVSGRGEVRASSDRVPPPVCAAPAANPEARLIRCPEIAAADFGTCRNAGRDQLCDITVTAVAPAGWAFRRWSPASSRCAGQATPNCTFRTRETLCDPAGEQCTVNEPGPFVMDAEFTNTRAPTVTFGAAPAAGRTLFDAAREAAFVFDTDEPEEAPAFRCARDGAAPAPCPREHTLRELADGIHTLCVTAADVSGAVGAPVCRTWRQETPPLAQLLSRPPAATSAASAVFTYASNKVARPADGTRVSFECRLDAGAFAACPDDGARFEGLGDGPHTFAVRAVFRAPDVVRASDPVAFGWSVDTVAPETTITSGPDDGATILDVAPTFEFGADEAATFTCTVDGGATQPCASPFTTPALTAGEHTVAITATDAVGNADPTPATASFTLVTGLGTLVDADRDGVPLDLDCDDGDASVRPGALEVPGNDVDENCDGVLAPLPRVTAVIAVGGRAFADRTRFTRLLVTGVPTGGRVQLRCSGRCPFRTRSLPVRNGRANGARRPLSVRVGATLEVRVTAPAMVGKVRRLRIVARRFPRGQELCLPPAGGVPRRCADGR